MAENREGAVQGGGNRARRSEPHNEPDQVLDVLHHGAAIGAAEGCEEKAVTSGAPQRRRLEASPRGVALLLTGKCNLSCAYCYQKGSKARQAMGWAVARSALETVLAWGLNEIVVEFTGGEPLLEVATLRRAVSFIEANRARDTAVSFTITTNGTLLTPQLTEFLLDRGFTIRLSFDGVDAAQGHRGEGTFRTLDRLLHNLREQHPSGFAKQLRIVVTLLASTIPLQAESVRYLLAKDVQTIEIAPRFTWDPDWRPSCRDGLERQVNEILRLSCGPGWLSLGCAAA